MKTPKTWNELLNAGYVVELDECQIAIAKDKLNPTPFVPIKTKEEQEALNNKAELIMRKKAGLS